MILRPCPYCGERESLYFEPDAKGWQAIACDNCGARGPYNISESAEAAWNRRKIFPTSENITQAADQK